MNNLLVNNKVTSCLPKIPSNTKSLLKDKQVNTGIKLLNIIKQKRRLLDRLEKSTIAIQASNTTKD